MGRISNDCSGPSVEIGLQDYVHRRVSFWARSAPERTAIVCGDEHLTYSELDSESNKLARHLRAAGAGSGRQIGVLLDRSADVVVALLAIVKSGGAYVPLDPAYPIERLRYMAADARLDLLITDAEHRGLVVSVAPRVCLDDDRATIALLSAQAVADGVGPGDLAYVIYTSGSTGRPKGVMVPHGALANVLCAMNDRVGLDARDVFVAVTPFSFDIAALELFSPLVAGACSVIADRKTARSGDGLASLLESSGATVLQGTPATWRLLIAAGWKAPAGFKALCGGEALPPDVARVLSMPGVFGWNLYGPTETTIWSTAGRIRSASARPSIIGTPIWNTDVHVLDAEMAPCPAGTIGGLYVAGQGVAHGYFGRPDLTAERFFADPAGGADARMYWTGDLACRRADGELEFHGRADDQVKIDGHRVELGEIEAVMTEHPSVLHAAAAVRGSPENRTLVVYVVPADRQIAIPMLFDHLKTRLPHSMMPKAIVFLDALPTLPNGKTDRRSLPDPSERAVAVARRAPPAGLDAVIAEIWARTLSVSSAGADDDFFALGGNSLLAMRVVGKLGETLGIKVPLSLLFEANNLAEFANHVRTLLPPGRGGMEEGTL